jgi:hypothetical protein
MNKIKPSPAVVQKIIEDSAERALNDYDAVVARMLPRTDFNDDEFYEGYRGFLWLGEVHALFAKMRTELSPERARQSFKASACACTVR